MQIYFCMKKYPFGFDVKMQEKSIEQKKATKLFETYTFYFQILQFSNFLKYKFCIPES